MSNLIELFGQNTADKTQEVGRAVFSGPVSELFHKNLKSGVDFALT